MRDLIDRKSGREKIDQLADVARKTLEGYLSKTTPKLNPPADYFNRQAGVFVTIRDAKGNLRGCIGTILPAYKNIVEETAENAISAGTKDNRFLPVSISELSDLNFEVSVLSEPVLINKKDHLNPKIDGLIIKSGEKIGVLLPNVEGIDDAKTQLDIAAQKAGIDFDKDQFKAYKFRVQTNL